MPGDGVNILSGCFQEAQKIMVCTEIEMQEFAWQTDLKRLKDSKI